MCIRDRGLAAVDYDIAFRVSDHIGTVTLSKVGFEPKSGLTAAGTNDHKHIFVSGICRILRAIAHPQMCIRDSVGAALAKVVIGNSVLVVEEKAPFKPQMCIRDREHIVHQMKPFLAVQQFCPDTQAFEVVHQVRCV